MTDKRAHVYYGGMVQGVGFRFTAQSRAERLGLKGWVKNLDDGRVEILCEGKESDIGLFLENMKSIFGTYISDIGLDWSNATGEYERFDIAFD